MPEVAHSLGRHHMLLLIPSEGDILIREALKWKLLIYLTEERKRWEALKGTMGHAFRLRRGEWKWTHRTGSVLRLRPAFQGGIGTP